MMEAHVDAGPLLDAILYREKSGGYFDGSLCFLLLCIPPNIPSH